MKIRLLLAACLGMGLWGTSLQGQEFATGGWYGRPVAPAWGTAPTMTYRVERDPRYRAWVQPTGPANYVAPASYETPPGYAAPVYRPVGDWGGCSGPVGVPADVAPTFSPQLPAYYPQAVPPQAVTYPYPPSPYAYSAPPLRYQMPRGHYRGDGLYGQDTVFVEGEPVRNLFRYLLP